MAKNIFQQQVVPDKPKVLAEERIYVYMPKANDGKKGLASFNTRDFKAVDGHVSLTWPTEMMVQTLADPTIRPALTKVLPDEFVKTQATVKMTNPVTGVAYESNTAEIKLNRALRNAIGRPDLIMVNANDFEVDPILQQDGSTYNRYNFKRNNPLVTPALIQVDPEDFKREDGVVKVKWSYAHQGDMGLVEVDPGQASSLKFNNGKLQVDTEMVKTNIRPFVSLKPTYTSAPEGAVDEFGIAMRNEAGNSVVHITKAAVGLSQVENRTFASRTYGEFGQTMKEHFDTKFGEKLNQSAWNALFSDWAPPTDDRNTVNRWFMRLEEEDNSLWSSIRTMNLFLGYYTDEEELIMARPASGTMLGSVTFNLETGTYWGLKPIIANRYQYFFRNHNGLESIISQAISDRAMNITTGEEFVWNGTLWVADGIHNGQWEWYDSEKADIEFHALVEQDAGNLQPNAPVANVSVGTSGRWIQSDHIHPSDPTKLDANLIENATIVVTTAPPSGNDFNVTLATVRVLDSDGETIQATIVTTPQYLSSVENPQNGDLAIARSTGQIYQYNGSAWLYTNEIGTITYDTQRTLNIPYVRTGQHIHNWQGSPTYFEQNANSNETYWAGSEEDYDALDLEDIPNNTLLIVGDEDDLQPGYFATVEQVEDAGLTLSEEGYPSSDRFVIVDGQTAPTGLVALEKLGSKYFLKSLEFTQAAVAQAAAEKLITRKADGTLGQRKFTQGRVIVSNADENLAVASFGPSDVALKDTLVSDYLVIAKDANTIKTMGTGAVANIPLVSDGTQGVALADLTANKVVKTNGSKGLTTVTWLESNLLKSNAGSNEVVLDSGKLIKSAANNILEAVALGGTENSLIVRAADSGMIKARSHSNNNRLIYTSANGTITEMAAGTSGQYLISQGNNVPTWTNGPGTPTHLPQTTIYDNPSEATANAYSGMVAVILQGPIPNNELRSNCIYFW